MRFAPFLLTAALVGAPAVRADDAADAKAIIEKAIKARGDKAGEVPAVTTWKEKTAINALGQRMDYDTEWTVQAPHKLRFQATTAIQGATLDVTVVVNGEKAWFLVNGFVLEVPPPQL